MDTRLDPSRLRWRCRRGTRELDQLLGWWFEQRFGNADPALQQAFADLLDEQDPDLWDWVMGRSPPSRPGYIEIIDAIRTRHSL